MKDDKPIQLKLSQFESLMLEGAIEHHIKLHLKRSNSIFNTKKGKETQTSIMGTFWSLKRRLIAATEATEA